MNQVKLYLYSGFDLCVLIIATLADIDVEIRILLGMVGIIVAILTAVKIVQQIRKDRIENKIKTLDLKLKEEEVRRFFENKHKKK